MKRENGMLSPEAEISARISAASASLWRRASGSGAGSSDIVEECGKQGLILRDGSAWLGRIASDHGLLRGCGSNRAFALDAGLGTQCADSRIRRNSMPAPAPVALITGSARRIGAAIARRLHAEGYDLALHYRDSAAEMQALAAELEAVRGDSVLTLQADLSEFDRLPELVARTVGRFGRLDALVNNASTFQPTPLGTATPAQWDALFASNARAPFFLAQAAT